MKIKLLIFFLIISFTTCERDTEKRKIKLSDEGISTKSDQQLTTTIHLEQKERRSIAVMFFQNLTGDNNLQWLQKGLTEMLIRALSQSRYLSVLSTDRVFEILNRVGKEPSPERIDLDMAAIVAKEAHVEALLTGNISKKGDVLKINVKVHEPNRGMVLREESVEGPGLENIFSMVDHLSQKIKQDLHLTLEEDEQGKGIADISTNSLEAWRYYTTGIELYNKLLFADAIPQFERAIIIDSTFVMAYLKLLSAYGSEGKVDKVIKIYEKLQTLRDYATEQELYRMGLIEAEVKSDIKAIIDMNQKWLQKFPDDREANLYLGGLYYNLHNYGSSILYLKKVLQIDPKYKLAINLLGYSYAHMGDFTSAISTLNKYKEITQDEPNPYDSLGEIYLLMGDYKQAEKHFKQALKVNEKFIASLEHLANVYLDKGDFKKALKTFKKYLEKVTDGVLKARAYSNIALTYWRLGDIDEAINNYQNSLESHVFQYGAVERLNEIYLENNDSTKAKQVLIQHYDRIKNALTSEILRNNFFFNLVDLSIWHDVNIDETINTAKVILAHSENPALKLRLKFILTILYYKSEQKEQIEKLWREHPASEIITHFGAARNLSYSDFWKYYSFFNQSYYQNIDRGIQDYKDFIKYAETSKVKLFETGFRLLLADLYFHEGDRENGEQQLKMVGMAEEDKWMVIGPFDNKNGFHKKYPPEKEIKLSKAYRGKTYPITWQHPDDGMKDEFIDFKLIYDKSNWSVAYGLIYLISPADKEVQIRVGSNEAIKIWLNNEQVWRFNQVRSAVLDEDIVNVTLKKGLNKILIKVCNRTNDWGFYFRVTDEQGNGVPDIRFVPPDEQV